MKAEWEALQQDPNSVDEQIKTQLDMLEQINKNAFNKTDVAKDLGLNTSEAAAENTNATEIGKAMQEAMR